MQEPGTPLTKIARIGVGEKKLRRHAASFYIEPEEKEEMDSLKSIGGSSLFDDSESDATKGDGDKRSIQRTAIGNRKLKRLEAIKSTSTYTKKSIESTGNRDSIADHEVNSFQKGSL
jgi:hypothetical protein